jgi:glyoxylase-like metal-dependent hydrolase (beta-lactamase superfamily II)
MIFDNWITRSFISLCVLGCISPPQGGSKEHPEIIRLADNVYVRVVSPDGDAVSNAGFVILENSVLVVDTHFTPEAGQALLGTIRSVTSKPVAFVVNSHAHADHTHGNQVFPEAQLIGSSSARRDVVESDLPSLNRTIAVAQSQLEKLRREITKEKDAARLQRLREQLKSREAYVQTMSRLKITAPVVALDEAIRIQDGKQEVRILYLGKGHTDGDVVVYLPAVKIAFVGDLFFNEAIPNVQDATLSAWMKTLEEVLKLDADKFVPGHGAVGNRKDVQNFLAYLEALQSLVKAAVERGDSVEQATKEITVPAKYAAYRFQNFFPSNVQKMYAELKALQTPVAPPAAPKK